MVKVDISREKELGRLKAALDRSIQRGADLEEVLDLLREEKSGETLVYRIWEYGERAKLENRLRNFGYEDPEDVLSSLEQISEDDISRTGRHELNALSYAFETVYEDLG